MATYRIVRNNRLSYLEVLTYRSKTTYNLCLNHVDSFSPWVSQYDPSNRVRILVFLKRGFEVPKNMCHNLDRGSFVFTMDYSTFKSLYRREMREVDFNRKSGSGTLSDQLRVFYKNKYRIKS